MVSNFKPGTLDAWGLGYEVVFEHQPRIIYGTGSTFGPIGADAEREGSGPGRPGRRRPDLHHRCRWRRANARGGHRGRPHRLPEPGRRGAGSPVRAETHRPRPAWAVSLVGALIWAQAPEYTSTFLSGTQPDRANWGHGLISFIYGILPTADGFVALVGVPPTEKAKFFTAIGQDLLADARFRGSAADPGDPQELFGHLRPFVVVLPPSGATCCGPPGSASLPSTTTRWLPRTRVSGTTAILRRSTTMPTAASPPSALPSMSETPLAVGDPAPNWGSTHRGDPAFGWVTTGTTSAPRRRRHPDPAGYLSPGKIGQNVPSPGPTSPLGTFHPRNSGEGYPGVGSARLAGKAGRSPMMLRCT